VEANWKAEALSSEALLSENHWKLFIWLKFKSNAIVGSSEAERLLLCVHSRWKLGSMKHIIWICGTDKKLVRERDNILATELLYTPSVCRGLSRCTLQYIPPASTPGASDFEGWSKALGRFDVNVFAVALVETTSDSCPDFLDELDSGKQEISDYLDHTRWAEDPFLFLRVIKSVKLKSPLRVYQYLGVDNMRFVLKITLGSMGRLLQSQRCGALTGADRIAKTIRDWRDRHADAIHNHNGVVDIRTALCMPLPHAVLVAEQQWGHCGFPVSTSNKMRAAQELGSFKAKRLLKTNVTRSKKDFSFLWEGVELKARRSRAPARMMDGYHFDAESALVVQNTLKRYLQ
jgi:hypothetical protein